MASFILNNDYHFLMSSYTGKSNDPIGIAVREMNPDSDGNIYDWTGDDKSTIIAYLRPKKTKSSSMYFNELEIYGVVIDGFKLQQLIVEIFDGVLCVNRQGLCLAYMKTSSVEGGKHRAYYPLQDLFNWPKYGVNVPNPLRELWSVIGIFPQVDQFNSFDDNASSWSVDQSKEIRLNADDLFISCKDYHHGEGPLILWKVESPSGHIRNVRFMGKIDCQWDMSRLEVKGVTLQGNKLRSLCKELNGRKVMVNVDGWCLFYTGIPIYSIKYGQGGNYYKILFRFDWEKYGVPTSENCSCIWGRKYYLDEVQTITQLVFSPEQHICGVKDEQNTYGLDLEKTKEDLYQKEKLKYLESELQEKKKDLRRREKQYQELKKLIKSLRAEQNKVIMGSIYREYCSNKSFEKRLQKLFAVSREMHVVLAFARDYDNSDRHTNGIFKEFFDQNVTPQLITNFKQNLPSNSIVKFFLCIGNRSQKYPFHMTDKARWITNATSSLQRIIQHYGFDGIDVYYTRSNINANDFVDAIGTMIDNLMTERIITTASLAPSPFMNRVNCNFYDELYNRNHHNFHYVVYQTHDDADSIPLNDAQALITIFNDLVSNHNYPKHKLLAGHSILPRDWDAVPYPVILTALPQLFKDGTVQGSSVWALNDDQP